MENKKMTVTIGIPAYNEEGNIASLADCLLKQSQSSFKLKKIIIASDGSTDKTVNVLKRINKPLLKIINYRERKGKPYRTDQIMANTKSDILVILDADILIKDANFLDKLVRPIILNRADLTSASIKELKPVTLMQKILAASMKFKKSIFENYKNGNNIYTCHGRARAFSKKLFTAIRSKDIIAADDAFSYLYCKYSNFKYFFAKEAVIFYKLPTSCPDHQKQSIRFFLSKQYLNKRFEKKFIDNEYYLPPMLLFKSLIKTSLKDLFIVVYLPIALALKIKSLFYRQKNSWHIASSTKSLLWINQN